MTRMVSQQGLISDANVLIDYAKSTPSVLRLISQHLQQLYVASPVLAEVHDFSAEQIVKLGIKIVEPSLEQLAEAGELRQTKKSISGLDALCFVMARDHRWICLTNDKALRNHCTSSQVTCLWGLEIMIQLVRTGQITATRAYSIACNIQSKNRYIKDETIERFREKLGLK
jgi:rRNA-processing protein FCF1